MTYCDYCHNTFDILYGVDIPWKEYTIRLNLCPKCYARYHQGEITLLENRKESKNDYET